MAKDLTPREADYSRWYTDVVTKSTLAMTTTISLLVASMLYSLPMGTCSCPARLCDR